MSDQIINNSKAHFVFGEIMNEGGTSLIRKASQHSAGKPDIYYLANQPTAQVATQQEKHEVANGVIITTDGFAFSGKLIIDEQLNVLMMDPKITGDDDELQKVVIKNGGKEQKVDRILFHNINIQRIYFVD